MPLNRSVHRVYVVTGAASGIGRATAKRLLDEGGFVHALDIDAAGLSRLVEERSDRDRLRAHTLDATSSLDWQRCGEDIRAITPSVDGCLLNIGKNMPGALLEISTDAWHDSLHLNLDANVFGFQAVVPLMQSEGSIVFTTSIHGFLGFRSFPGYAAAKGALIALTRQLAMEYAPRLRVNAVAPGAVLTAIWERRDEDFRRRVAARVPLNRIANASEIAGPIAFLLSTDASYVTGQTLVVDGGRSISSGE